MTFTGAFLGYCITKITKIMSSKNKGGRSIPKGAQRELPEEGTHNAVCVQVIDLGTQPSSNPDWGDKRNVMLGFELVEAESSGGNPVLVSRQFNYTDSAKGNLMKTLRAWLGVKDGEFDIEECLNKPALVTIQHNETDKGVFANIASIGPLTKGAKVRRAATSPVSLFLDDTFDVDVFEELPEWIRTKIAITDEYKEVMPVPVAKGKAAAPQKKAKR